MTFNTKIYDDWNSQLIKSFAEMGIELKVFDSYDGGGWVAHIVEFQKKKDLESFVSAYCKENNKRKIPECWVDCDDGHRELIHF